MPRSHSPSGYHHNHTPTHISHKGQLKLHLPGYVLLVHPPESTLQVEEGGSSVVQVQQPQEDTVLDGRLEIIMDKPRIARSIKVEFVVTARLQIPGESEWDEKELFIRMVEIGGGGRSSGEKERGDVDEPNITDGIRLEKGSQSFEFSLIIPATVSTYDRHPCGRISQSIRATVEGMPIAAAAEKPSFNLFGGLGLGKQRDKSRADSRGRGAGSGSGSRTASRPGSRPGSRAPSPTRQSRQNSVSSFLNDLNINGDHFSSASNRDRGRGRDREHDGHRDGRRSGSATPPALAEYSFRDPSLPPPHQHTDIHGGEEPIKPLKGSLLAERHLIVAANPSSNYGEGLTSLNVQKQGRLAGVGEWKLGLTSDAVSHRALFDSTNQAKSNKSQLLC